MPLRKKKITLKALKSCDYTRVYVSATWCSWVRYSALFIYGKEILTQKNVMMVPIHN